jgi:hypothetical protein
MRYRVYSLFTAGLFTLPLAAATINQGTVYFQTGDISGIDSQHTILYPNTPARVPTGNTSVGSNAAVPNNFRNNTAGNLLNNTPFPLRSWLGGALWGTNTVLTDFYIPSTATFSASRTWQNRALPQNAVFTDNYILQYLPPTTAPCGAPGSNIVDQQGISLNGLYPYLSINTLWNSTVNNPPYSFPQPLKITTQTMPQQDLQVMASDNTVPGPGQAITSGLTFQPQTLYVDRMGDFDADFVYTFDYPNANAYQYTPFTTAAGTGKYIKFTVCEGSPFIWCESSNVPYIFLRNRIGAGSTPFFKGGTAPATLPSNPAISYVLIFGNVDYPPAPSPNLNPQHSMDNFTTWAIYWRTVDAGYTQENPSNPNYLNFGEHNNSLNVTTPANKFWFVIAQLPVQRNYPTTGSGTSPGTAYNQTAATAYAEALGAYAFNFLTNTSVTYAVTGGSRVATTFSCTTYNPLTSVSAGPTILTLEPHHYQNILLGVVPGTNVPVGWQILDYNGSAAFSPSGAAGMQYWCVRGSLQAIAGISFKTNYLVSNFLHCMPPPNFATTFTSTTNPSQFSNVPIGEYMFWTLDYDFSTDVSVNNANPLSWGTIAYANVSTASYGTSFSLEFEARHLGILQGMLQYLGNNVVTSAPNYSENFSGAQKWIPNPALADWTNNRPGVSMANALQESTQKIQTMISNLFPQTPAAAAAPPAAPSSGTNTIIPCPLKNFCYYDADTGMIANHPVATGLSVAAWPSPTGSPASYSGAGCPGTAITPPAEVGTINEGFGVGSNWNDHHYHWGYWIAAAALAAIYDTAWTPSTPAMSTWANGSNAGPAIDAMVMDLAFDPTVDGVSGGFFRNSSMKFAKMNFFDQWAGHGWADGLQACNAGGGTGHNENSQEGSQPFASIALWGIATGRKPVADLGIYLYATASQAFDFYMLDKNFNYKPGGSSSFVPVITASGAAAVSGYPAGTSYWDYTIHTTNAAQNNYASSSGCPLLLQASTDYSTFFGNYPLSAEYIMSFPLAPWTLAIMRNRVYMLNWLEAMETSQFKSLIDYTDPSNITWNNSFVTNMLMAQAASNDPNPAIPALSGDSSSWLQWYLDQVTASSTSGPSFFPPWTGRWSGTSSAPGYLNFEPVMNVGLMPIADVLQFLASCRDYGTLDWTINAVSSGASSGQYLFAAAFANQSSGLTTFVAFNPFTTAQSVTFYRSWNSTDSIFTLSNVPAKSWAISAPIDPPFPHGNIPTPPYSPPVSETVSSEPCGHGGDREDRLFDIDCLGNQYDNIVNKARGKVRQ